MLSISEISKISVISKNSVISKISKTSKTLKILKISKISKKLKISKISNFLVKCAHEKVKYKDFVRLYKSRKYARNEKVCKATIKKALVEADWMLEVKKVVYGNLKKIGKLEWGLCLWEREKTILELASLILSLNETQIKNFTKIVNNATIQRLCCITYSMCVKNRGTQIKKKA